MNARHRRSHGGVLLSVAVWLAGCGGGDGGNHEPVTALASDAGAGPSSGSMRTGAPLLDPWGIAFDPAGSVRIADAETGSSILYDRRGSPRSRPVSIPAGSGGPGGPTGIVFSGSDDFVIRGPSGTGPSRFLFATAGGTLAGWSPDADPHAAITVFDGGPDARSYTGLALQAGPDGGMQLYATDFHNARVDVFDAAFASVRTNGGFGDPDLPAGYAPFGIQAFGNRLLVSFAKQDAEAEQAVAGTGFGIVDLFTSDGVLVRRLVSAGPLNVPWGMALAPAGFGRFGGALLIGNVGDGRINAFDAVSGRHLGTLSGPNGDPVAIAGLRGIAFGHGIDGRPTGALFFAAGPGDARRGVYGRIDLDG